MIATYRQNEIRSDGVPLPRPSSAPEDVTDTADTIKPRLMMRSASCPCRIVSASVVNSPMSAPGIAQHKIVPTSMIAAFIRSVRL